MRVVCISDTHDFFDDLYVPEGDLLIHGGDLSRRGEPAEIRASAEWLRALPHRHKVIIAGNHDFGLESQDPRELLSGLTYLQDEPLEVQGLRLYGSPWTVAHNDWAFQRPRGSPLAEMWAKIPENTQLLLTHSPPEGVRDLTALNEHAGCAELLRRSLEVSPLLHIFGHVHEGYGCEQREGVLFANASNSGLGYKFLQPALVFDWDGSAFTPVENTRASLSGRVTPVAGPGLWEELVTEHGPPRELRYLAGVEREKAVTEGLAFWVEVAPDRVAFRRCQIGEDLLDRGPGPALRRWAFTFGVDFPLGALADNPWRTYAEVPHLP